jgi:hypothetical protein
MDAELPERSLIIPAWRWLWRYFRPVSIRQGEDGSHHLETYQSSDPFLLLINRLVFWRRLIDKYRHDDFFSVRSYPDVPP